MYARRLPFIRDAPEAMRVRISKIGTLVFSAIIKASRIILLTLLP